MSPSSQPGSPIRCCPTMPRGGLLIVVWLLVGVVPNLARAAESPSKLKTEPPPGEPWPRAHLDKFLTRYCGDCHAGGGNEGGFAMEDLADDLSDPATFARWLRIFDRVRDGEMPPPDADEVPDAHASVFARMLGQPLHRQHEASKGTIYRRLNRREYQNTMNDFFGTNLDLESRLPEDGRSHEFDNVGEALGISVVHMQQYLDAADDVIDAAMETTAEPPEIQTVTSSYNNVRESEKFIGEVWEQLDDGFVAFYERMGYPSGMLRGTEVKPPGRYKVRVQGYAHRSDEPITLRIGGTSFLKGSPKVTYGYFEVPPGPPTTIEFEAHIADRYMIEIDPWGIDTGSYNIRKEGLAGYDGPGIAIGDVQLIGPLREEFPSRGQRKLFADFERVVDQPATKWRPPTFKLVAGDPSAAASTLHRIAGEAFRRPVEPSEVQRYVDLFNNQLAGGASNTEALRTAVAALLCSPDFLYFMEPEGWLDDHALASRLSYFLTRTAPDKALRTSADSGQLTRDPDSLLGHTQRLIAAEHFDRFVADFCDAWLDLREIEFTSPDQTLFPEFDEYLQYSMVEETRSFVAELIRGNLPVTNVVKSDFAMLNERLAEHYEITGVSGPEIRRVPLPENSLRGGILTHASILKVSANGTNTSPVVRGVWVMERVVGTPPQPPPPGIPGVEPDIRGATTLRELLDKHRNMDSCRACHTMIDPPGFALECFNPIGGFRERFRSLGKGDKVSLEIAGRKVRYRNGPPVDASGQLPDGSQFKDFREFRDLLAGQPEVLATAMVKKLLTFATGREMGFSDRPMIARIVDNTKDSGYRIGDLLEQVVVSEAFRRK